MNLSTVLLLVCMIAVLVYALIKTLGKNIGYGSSDSEREMLRNAPRAMKSKQDSRLDNMTQSDKNGGIETVRRPAIIRISELKIEKQDSLVLSQIDQNDQGVRSQDVVDSFYLFGQSLIEKELMAAESATNQDDYVYMLKNVSINAQAHENEIRAMKIMDTRPLLDYFAELRASYDVDFLVYKLTGIRDVKLSQGSLLSFLAETLCAFNLYDKAKNGYSRLNKQLRYLFAWAASVDFKSWPNLQWRISGIDFKVA